MLIKTPSRILLPFAISFAGLSLSSAQANEFDDESHELDAQVVSGRLYANPVSAAAFNVTVLEQADLQRLPVNNVVDALEYVSGIDVRKRGISGVQADVGIRGSTYEQTLVLLDGVRMNDPQTGHHNFDLPIAYEDIERIEIVKGPGAAQYGPSSNGGVINIVSRKEIISESGRKAKVNIQRGSYDYERYALSLAKTEGEYSQFLSGYHSASDSYIRDEALDSRQGQGSYRVVHQGENTTSQVAFGYVEKDFGAYRFYVDQEAQSRESTSQRHGYGIHQYRFANGSQIEASLNWRNHFDVYKYQPTSSASEHETEALQSRLTFSNGSFVSGLEFNQENMDSNRDGRQGRHFASAFLNYKQLIGANVSLTGNLSYVDYDSQDQFVLPVIGIDALISENVEVYANAGQSVRTPTLNDLYLNMPGRDLGSENLELEKTDSAEVGVRLNSSDINITASVFYKDTQDAIDFTKTQAEFDASLAHIARNYGKNETKGFDVEFDASAFSAMRLGMSTLKLTHTRLIQTIDTDLVILKNTDGQLENQTALHAGFDFYNHYSLLTTYKYESRFDSEDYEILDLRLAYQDDNLTIALNGSNLLDAEYIDAGFVEVAGPALILEFGYQL
ncbi:TonB-dependent receptor [Oleispira antarctica RB-8]|uniref:TonB-dependent receptor n=1 Tax=Oleispira antarctica RB-8 TaxID=698738 RepID=R4YS62_OLEAN|nr:TonB-dependent receptor [Oleispira antarctica RB-8]